MADRRIYHANTELTDHSRTSSRLEQRSHRRSKAPAETQTCLGHPRSARIGREPSRSGFVQYGHRQQVARLRPRPDEIRGSNSFRADQSPRIRSAKQNPKPVRFEISEGTRASIAKWMEDSVASVSVATLMQSVFNSKINDDIRREYPS